MSDKLLKVRIFKHKILIDALTKGELEALTKDFRVYKETGQKPDIFGRDEAYDHPDAHEQARNRTIMHNLGLIAEKFRQQF